MLPGVTVLDGSDAAVDHMIGPCPQCDGLGTAVMYTTLEGGLGRTVATHPAGVLLATQITQSLLEDGKVGPEEAVNMLRAQRPLAPLLDWIDENTNRLGLLVGALGLVIAGTQMLEDDGLSEAQIEQIVRSVVNEMDDRPSTLDPVSTDQPARLPTASNLPPTHL